MCLYIVTKSLKILKTRKKYISANVNIVNCHLSAYMSCHRICYLRGTLVIKANYKQKKWIINRH